MRDDKKQADAAAKVLKSADLIAVPLACLCELVWVLRRVCGFGQQEISSALRTLLDANSVVVNRPAVEAGLKIHEAGGDFADGVIAYEGRWLGGEVFVSFHKAAVTRIAAQGQETRLLT